MENEIRGPVILVVGESFDTKWGKPRQHVIAGLSVGDPVTLVADPHNKHDPDAVAIYARTEDIGYLERNEDAYIRQVVQRHGPIPGWIYAIDGGTPDKPSYGVRVIVDQDVLDHPSMAASRLPTGLFGFLKRLFS